MIFKDVLMKPQSSVCCEGNVVPSTFASEFDTRKALYRIDPC